MNQCRRSHALVSCKDSLYAVGGFGNGNCLASVEGMKDLNGDWQECQSMPEERKWLTAVSCDDAIYAMGGLCCDNESKDEATTKTVEKYDPVDDEWSL